jgi:FtsP/CotA-like multicopper oxidase with cupredoxin domain/plastocyanin
MPEWLIVISLDSNKNVVLNPNSQEVTSGDIVSWSNRTDDTHTIVIEPYKILMGDPPTETNTELTRLEAQGWSSSDAYKTTKPASNPQKVAYKCDGATGEITFKTAVLLMVLLAGLFATSLRAQAVKCSDLIGGELTNPQEIAAGARGTLATTGEKQLIAFVKNRVEGKVKETDITCTQQWVRTYRKGLPADSSQQPDAPATLPQPGPTIRARVGGLVELSFVNVIDPLNFPGTDTGKCDAVQGATGQVYAQSPKDGNMYKSGGDVYPNCFHGSVFTNVHFHGTHTSPNSTADNVFLQIVPSPREKTSQRSPTPAAKTAEDPFKGFYDKCELNLNDQYSPQQWPQHWSDVPAALRDKQYQLMCGTLSAPECQAKNPLYKANQDAIGNGQFPQNFSRSIPYCFRLPDYKPSVFPPPPQAAAHTAGEHDASLAPQRPLMMGQAPGTHWYHAHKHGSTTLNVSNGMTGVMIVEGAYDAEIKKFYKTVVNEYGYGSGRIQEKVLVLNQIGVTPKREGGTEPSPGPYFSVNGRLQPTITMIAGEVQLWRIANTSSRTGVIFTPPANVTWRQLAQDGVQLNNTDYLASENKELVLASGNRADLLVKAREFRWGETYPIAVVLTIDPTTDRKTTQLLLNIDTPSRAGSSEDLNMPFMERAPSLPPFLTDIKDTDIKDTGGANDQVFDTVRKDSGFTNHTINGKLFNHTVGARVDLNQVQEWKVSNGATNIAHPFHIHINPFQVTDVFAPNDTALIEPGKGTVSIADDQVTVIGVGTEFTKQVRPGWILNITGTMGTVLSVQDDKKLTLTKKLGFPRGPDNPYTINVRRYVSSGSPMEGKQCLLDPNDPSTWKPCSAGVTVPPRHLWWDVFFIPSGRQEPTSLCTIADNCPAVIKDYTSCTTATAGKPAACAVTIPGYFKMRSRFVDYSGYFVLHCHILAHEDRGMMTIVNVVSPDPPFSHN